MTTTVSPTKTTRLADYIAEGLVASVGQYSNNAGTSFSGGLDAT